MTAVPDDGFAAKLEAANVERISLWAARETIERLTDNLIWRMLREHEDPTDYELWKRRKAAAITEARRLLDVIEQNTRAQV